MSTFQERTSANSAEPGQMQSFATSDQILHWLQLNYMGSCNIVTTPLNAYFQDGWLHLAYMNELLKCHASLTHCILNRLSHTIYWKSPISSLGTSGYEIYIFLEKNGETICKQWRPWSDDVWSGSALFAKYPFMGLPTTMG